MVTYGTEQPAPPVLTFMGKPEFTAESDVARGVVPESYAESITAGARFWDTRTDGFLADFTASSDWPTEKQVTSLVRIDAPRPGEPARRRSPT